MRVLILFYISVIGKLSNSFEWVYEPDQVTPGKYPVIGHDNDPDWEGITSNYRAKSIHCECGHSNNGANIRMGLKMPKVFPWQAVASVRVGLLGQSMSCGATIINDLIVMTAAQCVHNSNWTVIFQNTAGVIKVFRITKYNGVIGQEYIASVEYIVLHPKYNTKFPENGHDIALLILKRRLNFYDKLRLAPVCLPSSGDKITVENGTEGIVMEYGDFKNTEIIYEHQIIKRKNITFLHPNTCEISLYGHTLGKNQYYCFRSSGRGIHGGDYGGPVMITLPTKHMLQVGIGSLMNHFESDAFKRDGNGFMNYYINVKDQLPFIDYYSKQVHAIWCTRPSDPI